MHYWHPTLIESAISAGNHSATIEENYEV
jgi:hypothetical protein